MPIVAPAPPSPSGTPLSFATNPVYDYEYDEGGLPLVGVEIIVTLFPSQGAKSISPVSNLSSLRYKAITGADGRWQIGDGTPGNPGLIPSTNISTADGQASYYVLNSPLRGTTRFVVPATPGIYQAGLYPAP